VLSYEHTEVFMSQELMEAELSALRKRAELLAGHIFRIRAMLATKQDVLRQVVREYEKARTAHLAQQFVTRKLKWCTHCHGLVPENEVALVLTEERKPYLCGYQNAEHAYHDVLKLHRACLKCREDFTKRNGWRGEDDSQEEGQERFDVFQVERRDDGYYYVHRPCGWVKLIGDEYEIHELDVLPMALAKELETVWSLSPKIEIKEGRLVIHDRAEVSEAI
jgi:hypothetical protein